MYAVVPLERQNWLPPLRFRLRPYLKFDRAFSEALAELESRHPQRRTFTLNDRQHTLLKRRPR